MTEDLNLTGNRYSWLLTIFYISYTVFEFQALMWKIVEPHQWAAFVVFSWYAHSHVETIPPEAETEIYTDHY
jgi:hypothetical protein